MNGIIRSCIVLFIVSSVCVTALAYVNEITLEPIKLQEEKAEKDAYKELFGRADDFRDGEASFAPDGIITGVVTAYESGAKSGYIVKLTQKGFGGPINMLCGIEEDGSVAGIAILSHSETAGLGAECKKSWFTDGFKGKSQFPLSVVKMDAKENEVEAITSATITTKYVTEAVNAAHEWFVETEGGGK